MFKKSSKGNDIGSFSDDNGVTLCANCLVEGKRNVLAHGNFSGVSHGICRLHELEGYEDGDIDMTRLEIQELKALRFFNKWGDTISWSVCALTIIFLFGQVVRAIVQ